MGRSDGSTRLSRLHPYPAMVADELALALTVAHVRTGMTVLDPFCGSGRLLAASAGVAGIRAGADINPLACLITRAKLAAADAKVIDYVFKSSLTTATNPPCASPLDATLGRKVSWLSGGVAAELGQIIVWLNSLRLEEPELIVVGAALSAAARDASYARKGGWKLHRMGEDRRHEHKASAWTALSRRLKYCADELARLPRPACTPNILEADSKFLGTHPALAARTVDLVLTSPPYGDSRTTVQYGAASELCLEVVSKVGGLEEYAVAGRNVDALSLGGGDVATPDEHPAGTYWKGDTGSKEGRAVAKFLRGYADACDSISGLVKPGGMAVFVVGCRSTGGEPLLLDKFTADRMCENGFRLAAADCRTLRGKKMPSFVNRYGRSQTVSKRSEGAQATMSEEVILSFTKPVISKGRQEPNGAVVLASRDADGQLGAVRERLMSLIPS